MISSSISSSKFKTKWIIKGIIIISFLMSIGVHLGLKFLKNNSIEFIEGWAGSPEDFKKLLQTCRIYNIGNI